MRLTERESDLEGQSKNKKGGARERPYLRLTEKVTYRVKVKSKKGRKNQRARERKGKGHTRRRGQERE